MSEREDVEGLAEYERLKLAYVENTLAANEHDAAGFKLSARPLSEAAEEAEKALDAYVATLREQVERLRGERKVERVADVPAFVAESVMELTTRADTLQREAEEKRAAIADWHTRHDELLQENEVLREALREILKQQPTTYEARVKRIEVIAARALTTEGGE